MQVPLRDDGEAVDVSSQAELYETTLGVMMNSQHKGESQLACCRSRLPWTPKGCWEAWRALVHPAQKVVTEILPMFSVLGQEQVVTIKSLCNPEALQEGVWGVPRPKPC